MAPEIGESREKREVLGGNEYSKWRRQPRRRRNNDKYWKRAGISSAPQDPSQIFGTAATKATIKINLLVQKSLSSVPLPRNSWNSLCWKGPSKVTQSREEGSEWILRMRQGTGDLLASLGSEVSGTSSTASAQGGTSCWNITGISEDQKAQS